MPDNLVEEIAKAIAEAQGGSWLKMDEAWRDGYRRDAKAGFARLDSMGYTLCKIEAVAPTTSIDLPVLKIENLEP